MVGLEESKYHFPSLYPSAIVSCIIPIKYY